MIEYIKRYDQFARYLNRQGILVIGNDHLGHGETAKKMTIWVFCPSNMSETVVADLYEVTRLQRKITLMFLTSCLDTVWGHLWQGAI